MSTSKQPSSQARALRLLRTLAGREFDGLRPGQIATALQTTPSNVSRDLRILQDEGWVELVPGADDRWRLGPTLVQIANAYTRGLERLRSRLGEVESRYTREVR